MPSTAFEPFYKGDVRSAAARRRQRLLRLFRNASARPFYVIGIAGRTQDLQHEIAHALFFTRPAYRQAVRAAMRDYDTSALEKRLATMGYHRHVLLDEVHAYLVAPADALARHVSRSRRSKDASRALPACTPPSSR